MKNYLEELKTRAMAPIVKALPDPPEEKGFLSLNWKENPAAKKILDALVSILKEEYIQKAKENPEIFSK
jgi:hypothetical protein